MPCLFNKKLSLNKADKRQPMLHTSLGSLKTSNSAYHRLASSLLESLGRLPLHRKTLDVLERKLTSPRIQVDFVLPMAQIVSEFEKAASRARKLYQHKALESLIYYTHFVWNNPLPSHLIAFQKNYTDMLMFWPYEHHRSILTMEKPGSTSLRYLWDSNNVKVLSMMKYTKNPWLNYEDHKTFNTQDLRDALNLVKPDAGLNSRAQYGSLSNIQRDLLFHAIFNHYMFLKRNPRLCKNGRSLAIPIVEIPMRPLGNDIAAVRIKNLFKKKVASTMRILSIENPVLSRENESLLSDIINDALTRKQRRLYQAACKRAYIIEDPTGNADNRDYLLEFKPSSLLLKNI